MSFHHLLAQMLAPLSVVIVCQFVGLVALCLTSHRVLGRWLLAIVWVLVWLAATPALAYALLGGLERDYPRVTLAQCVPGDAIVVLGGALRPALTTDPVVRLHAGSDRVLLAASLYHQRCAPYIFVSAGSDAGSHVVAPEGIAIRQLLVSLGVPLNHIQIETESVSTQQNAKQSRAHLSAEVRRIWLVTSAFHMRRAVREFERVGFVVSPAPADFRGVPVEGLADGWPSAQALMLTQLATKEYMAAVMAHLR